MQKMSIKWMKNIIGYRKEPKIEQATKMKIRQNSPVL